jgi:hypothetical protein
VSDFTRVAQWLKVFDFLVVKFILAFFFIYNFKFSAVFSQLASLVRPFVDPSGERAGLIGLKKKNSSLVLNQHEGK